MAGDGNGRPNCYLHQAILRDGGPVPLPEGIYRSSDSGHLVTWLVLVYTVLQYDFVFWQLAPVVSCNQCDYACMGQGLRALRHTSVTNKTGGALVTETWMTQRIIICGRTC